MTYKRKPLKSERRSKSAVRQAVPNVEQDERLSAQTAGQRAVQDPVSAAPSDVLALQHSTGNKAVESLLVQRMALKDKGAHAGQLGDAERKDLLQKLYQGQVDVWDYIGNNSVCYDAVAFVRFLQGKLTESQLLNTIGQNWVSVLNFTGGTQWAGGAIPAGSAIGFKRVGGNFFHAAVATGGTTIRAINGLKLGAAWTVPADLAKELQPAGNSQYSYDNNTIEVWYI